jgi:hypothetical protein
MKKWINETRREADLFRCGRRSRGWRTFYAWGDALRGLRLQDLRFMQARYPNDWDWSQDVLIEISGRLGIAYEGIHDIGWMPCREVAS